MSKKLLKEQMYDSTNRRPNKWKYKINANIKTLTRKHIWPKELPFLTALKAETIIKSTNSCSCYKGVSAICYILFYYIAMMITV